MSSNLRAFVLCAVLGLGFVTASLAQTWSPDCPIAGRYQVVGRQPGETASYTGEAIISANPGGCRMQWFPPNTSEGTGTYVSGVLTINFTFENGGRGVVRYTRAGNGELHGVWWMNANPDAQGTESLLPIALAPR